MSKKALIIIGFAAVIAASTGVAFASDHDLTLQNNQPKATNAVDINDEQSNHFTDDGVYADGEEIITKADDEDNVISDIAGVSQNEPTDAVPHDEENEESQSSQTPELDITAALRIQRVVERSTGVEQSPQVLFGKYANSCYLTLYNNGTLEICLNPSADTVDTGTYTVAGETMYVDYGNDVEKEYQIIFDSNNEINSLIVPYHEYDIYFN